MIGTLPSLAVEAAIILFSGVLRGFTGFGFSLFSVPLLSLFMPPFHAVTLLMGLQALSGLLTLSEDYASIDWHEVKPLLLSSTLTVWVGTLLLGFLEPGTMKILIGLIILSILPVLASGWRFKGNGTRGMRFAVGGVSGLLNGLAAMGGPPLVVYFLANSKSPEASRASMTFIFMIMGALSLAINMVTGAAQLDIWLSIAGALPLLALGTIVGSKLFRRSSAMTYRYISLVTLASVACLSLLNGLHVI